jgi:hypothetical protein
VLNGPLQLVGSNFAAVARIPIFIQNASLTEDFGSNRTRERGLGGHSFLFGFWGVAVCCFCA